MSVEQKEPVRLLLFVIITFYEMWHILSDDKNIINITDSNGNNDDS